MYFLRLYKKYVPLIETQSDEGFKEKYLSKKPLSFEDEGGFLLAHNMNLYCQ
jgi:hypothetical protein